MLALLPLLRGAALRSGVHGMPRTMSLAARFSSCCSRSCSTGNHYYPSIATSSSRILASPLPQQRLNRPFPPSAIAASTPTSLLQQRQVRNISKMSFQAPHPTLLIPGPIEFDDEVLKSMSHYSESHVGAGFVKVFGETLTLFRQVVKSTDPNSQPFIINGSGTLGWDLVAANLVEAGEEALVLSTGYFGDRFADCLTQYGAKVTKLDGEVGGCPSFADIEKALSQKKFKVITATHVDTSTGVLFDLKGLTEVVKRVSPETLVIADGVCSVAAEELAFDEWGLDGLVTAGQKAIGAPAGLSLTYFSSRAVKVAENRKTPPAAYFANMQRWLPIMKNYEANKPSYFSTPSPQLIHALNTAFKQVLAKGMDARIQKHVEVSDHVKKVVKELGLSPVATQPKDQSHAMTAIYLPEGVQATDVLPKLLSKGIIFAPGLHATIGPKYVRFGHMGVSSIDSSRGDVDRALEAFRASLAECGYKA